MGATTKIEWCTHTSSPWHGCSKVAPGCDHCYAARQAVRNPGTLGIWGDEGTRIKSKSFISNLRLWNARAAKEGRAVSVFPSICDPFEDRPELMPWRQEMFATIDECPWVRLLLLTKRPENVRRMWPTLLGSRGLFNFLRNVWLVTSIATQEDADRNIPLLKGCRTLTPILGVSAEPLIEAVNLNQTHRLTARNESPLPRLIDGLDWLIVGGESGHGARPCNVDWIRSLRDQCAEASVPCFVKQLGSHISGYEFYNNRFATQDDKGGDWSEWPEDLRVRQFPAVEQPA